MKALEDAKAWQGHATDDERFSEKEILQLETDVSALKEQYGEAYLGGYGWASEAWRRRTPEAKGNRITFELLERAIDFGPLLNGRYRQASHAVHPTSKGVHFNLSSPPSREHLPSTPSPYGLFGPGWNTCQSIFIATATLLSIDLDTHREAALEAFAELTKDGLHLFVACQQSAEQATSERR